MPFLTPDADVVSIIDSAPTPLASPSPTEQFAILVHYQAHPPIAMLARPRLSLAGLRLDPQIAARQRTRRFTGLSVLQISDGTQRPLALPEKAQVSIPVWAPDGFRFAFTVDEPDGVGVWTGDVRTDADPVQVPGLRVRDVLGAEPPALGGTVRWSRDGRWLYVLGAPQDEGRSVSGASIEPRVSEVAAKKSQMATFQDLLTNRADEDTFEALATTTPLRVDPETGAATRLGPDGLYQYVGESPDRSYLLVYRLQRPFSYRVPYGYFARRVEVWSPDGAVVRIVSDLPVSDEVPRMGVPTGPRQVSWDERAPATLIWTEALDGGDPVAPAEFRDAIMRLDAPFSAPPELAFKLAHRCLDWVNLDEPGAMLVTEHDRDRRWLTTWLCYPAEPARNTVIFDLAEDDSYSDPGIPMMRLNPDGTRTIRQDGSAIFLRGEGATPEGERPFLDRRDLRTGSTTRLLHSPADAHETVLCFVAGRTDQAVIWHESPAEPPNLWVVALTGDTTPRQLTSWPDPHPWLTGMRKQLVSTDRGDGVQLSGLLHTPPHYDPDRDGPLPLVIWAYPHDFGSAVTAGQVRGSSTRFTRLTASDPASFVLRGYAVLANATMPVIGDPETKNDTYIEQITAAA
ncbi:MAG: hypothetical protein ACTHKL_06390, partial [Streptosporangiaceae bacterium]